jgi:Gpi18-like mannosyltransferase
MSKKLLGLLLQVLSIRFAFYLIPWILIPIYYPEKQFQNLPDFIINSWDNWDSSHYLNIALNGYSNVGDAANRIVFLPLYPMIIKTGTYFFQNITVYAGLISLLFFILGCLIFYKLLRTKYSHKDSYWAIIFLSLFPTAYFFGIPYTESLFFYLFSLSFWYGYKKKWLRAGIISGLAVIAKPIGIFLVPSLFIEWFLSKNKRWTHVLKIFIPSLLLGLSYLYLNYLVYDDPFAFQEILKTHWFKSIALPTTGFISTWKIALSSEHALMFRIYMGLFEALAVTLPWILLILGLKKIRTSWFFYSLVIMIFITSTEFIQSSPRYLLSIIPLFILLPLTIKSRYLRYFLLIIFVSLKILFVMRFSVGQWAF